MIKGLDALITPDWLDEHDACSDGKAWALERIGQGVMLEKLLPMFDRADWLIWTLARTTDLPKVEYVRIAVICAREVLSTYEAKHPDDKRPANAIRAAIQWCEEPTEENRIAAAAASYAAAAASYAAAAASYAAAAADAADAASYAAFAASVAANAAANAAAIIIAASAVSEARKEMHAKLCRQILDHLEIK